MTAMQVYIGGVSDNDNNNTRQVKGNNDTNLPSCLFFPNDDANCETDDKNTR